MEFPAETATTTAVVARVKHLRRQARLSGAELASGMAKLGFRWNQSTVAKLEAGRRRSVSVDELLALADVFTVPITALLVDERAERIDLGEGREYTPTDVLLWLTADRALPGTPNYDRVLMPQGLIVETGPWVDAALPARRARALLAAHDAALNAREALTSTTYRLGRRVVQEAYSPLLRNLAHALDLVHAAGMASLPIDDRLQHDARQLGVSLNVNSSTRSACS